MKNLYERYPELNICKAEIEATIKQLIDVYNNKGKVLLCGNGGSCADCDHIVGELMKGFLLNRTVDFTFEDHLIRFYGAEGRDMAMKLQGGLPAISLPAQSALLSAYANDVDADMVYAQLVYGYANPQDLLICISTSGNSKNVVNAAKIAKAKGIIVCALTGANESLLSDLCDITIRAPRAKTYQVQELHLPIYHYICATVEKHFYGN